jgi:hypothetical protein
VLVGSKMPDNFLPLSARAAHDLYARARELRSMAATAGDVATIAALIRLAERFEALAAARFEMSSAVAGPASDASPRSAEFQP